MRSTLFGVADKHRDTGDAAGQQSEFMLASGAEIVAQQQVFGGIAAERQLRRQQEVGPLRASAFGKIEDPLRVAGEVADRGVDLGNGNLQRHGRDH